MLPIILVAYMIIGGNTTSAQQEEDCHCIKIDIQPNINKAKGEYTNITGYAALNSTDSDKKTVDVNIDIEWIIKMWCAGMPGQCQATIVPTVQANWNVGHYDGSQNSQTVTPATINCQGKCDTPVHTTETQSKANTNYKFTITKQGGGQATNDRVSGTLTITLADSSIPPCPIVDNTVTIYFSANMKNGNGDGKIKVR